MHPGGELTHSGMLQRRRAAGLCGSALVTPGLPGLFQRYISSSPCARAMTDAAAPEPAQPAPARQVYPVRRLPALMPGWVQAQPKSPLSHQLKQQQPATALEARPGHDLMPAGACLQVTANRARSPSPATRSPPPPATSLRFAKSTTPIFTVPAGSAVQAKQASAGKAAKSSGLSAAALQEAQVVQELVAAGGAVPHDLPPGVLGLPGMAPGAAPASAQALLQAVKRLSTGAVERLLTELQAALFAVTAAGHPRRFFLLDTETTTCHQALEVHVVDAHSGAVFDTLVRPWVDDSILRSRIGKSEQIHGIGAHMLADAPSSQQAVLALQCWMFQCCRAGGGATPVLVAHNVAFDSRVLHIAFVKAGVAMPDSWLQLCTLALAKALLPTQTGYGLKALATQLGLSQQPTHRAAADVATMSELIHRVLGARWPGTTLMQVQGHLADLGFFKSTCPGRLKHLEASQDDPRKQAACLALAAARQQLHSTLGSLAQGQQLPQQQHHSSSTGQAAPMVAGSSSSSSDTLSKGSSSRRPWSGLSLAALMARVRACTQMALPVAPAAAPAAATPPPPPPPPAAVADTPPAGAAGADTIAASTQAAAAAATPPPPPAGADTAAAAAAAAAAKAHVKQPARPRLTTATTAEGVAEGPSPPLETAPAAEAAGTAKDVTTSAKTAAAPAAGTAKDVKISAKTAAAPAAAAAGVAEFSGTAAGVMATEHLAAVAGEAVVGEVRPSEGSQPTPAPATAAPRKRKPAAAKSVAPPPDVPVIPELVQLAEEATLKGVQPTIQHTASHLTAATAAGPQALATPGELQARPEAAPHPPCTPSPSPGTLDPNSSLPALSTSLLPSLPADPLAGLSGSQQWATPDPLTGLGDIGPPPPSSPAAAPQPQASHQAPSLDGPEEGARGAGAGQGGGQGANSVGRLTHSVVPNLAASASSEATEQLLARGAELMTALQGQRRRKDLEKPSPWMLLGQSHSQVAQVGAKADRWYTDKQMAQLSKAGLHTPLDVLMHFPRDYTQYSTRVMHPCPDEPQRVSVDGWVVGVHTQVHSSNRAVLRLSVRIPQGAVHTAGSAPASLPSEASSSSGASASTASATASASASGTASGSSSGDASSSGSSGGSSGAVGLLVVATRVYFGPFVASVARQDAAKWGEGSAVRVQGLLMAPDSSPPKRPRKASAKSKAQAEVQQEAGDCVVPEAEFLAVPPEDLECLEQGQGSQYLERLVPVYPALTPLDPADFFRYSSRQPDLITRALRGAAAAAEGAPDLLLQVPGLQPLQLLPWQTAIQAVHRPVSLRQLQDAFRRLAFQEMFFLQLQLLRQRAQFLKARSDLVSVPTISAPSVVAQALAALPFSLTGAQQRAVQELLADMQQPYPMFRLLQGDVGSGKTAVASLAMLAAAASGYQALLLVPTEILAQQHCQALTALVEGLPLATRRLPGLAEPPCLLTAATTATKKGKAVLVEGLQSGRLMLAVGTHSALNISDWSRLGLVVIDEQHRFGVEQKGQVMSLCSSLQPHLLSMSATPIPRTMALVKFGEMVVSALYEMPPGRSLVHTRVVTNDLEGEEEVHQAVRHEVSSGGRVFMVYPRRDAAPGAEEEGELAQLDDWEVSPLALAAGQLLASPQLLASEQALPGEALPQAQGKGSRVSAARRAAWESLSSAEEELERHTQLQTFGPGVKLGVIHGRMSSQAKADAIAGFREGQVQVLLSTSVVEVGVDVPQATLMVVHHAERFGLAQLHQLRGRVGRGQRQSRCLLVSGSYDVLALKRLRVMETCHNGLDIAEEDMKLRGAGSVFGTGTTQSGGSECSNLTLDAVTSEPRIVEAARVAAAHVIRSGMTDSELHYAAAAYAAHSSAKSRAKPAATKKPVKRKPATSSKKVVAAKPKSRTKKAASPVAAATLLPASPVTPRARKSASGKGIGLPV